MISLCHQNEVNFLVLVYLSKTNRNQTLSPITSTVSHPRPPKLACISSVCQFVNVQIREEILNFTFFLWSKGGEVGDWLQCARFKAMAITKTATTTTTTRGTHTVNRPLHTHTHTQSLKATATINIDYSNITTQREQMSTCIGRTIQIIITTTTAVTTAETTGTTFSQVT